MTFLRLKFLEKDLTGEDGLKIIIKAINLSMAQGIFLIATETAWARALACVYPVRNSGRCDSNPRVPSNPPKLFEGMIALQISEASFLTG